MKKPLSRRLDPRDPHAKSDLFQVWNKYPNLYKAASNCLEPFYKLT